ncbi:MAG TPA: carbamate kinase [Acidimicrobiales bacterium]|nr:carbamate kinase [Acidimicrobiales bacterium]
MRVVAALGGNALLQRGEKPAAAIQRHHVDDAVAQLALVARDHELVVTHGNGPQVGLLAVESANDPELAQPYPLDVIGAQTQGMIGYWLLEAFSNALPDRPAVALVTRTVVSEDDPSFEHPTKFVGIGYDEAEARRLAATSDWTIARDGACWRRVVASPEPHAIIESPMIQRLAGEGVIVVCAGGGGIPVLRGADGRLSGVEGVIDKDLATALIAHDLRADVMLLLTDVPGVYRDYGTSDQQVIRLATAKELRAMSFSAGSMGPKVEAACRFVESRGTRAAIGTLDDALGLLGGTSGTTVVRDAQAYLGTTTW